MFQFKAIQFWLLRELCSDPNMYKKKLGHATLGEGVLEGQEDILHVGEGVGGQEGAGVDRGAVDADEPEVAAVSVGSVGIRDVARDAAPEVEEATLAH
ncbi:hypothetical protein HYQ46_001120, partial [Verticillium longisporum]